MMERSFWNYPKDMCPVCRKEIAVMGSSEWLHDYICCSNACGFRLKMKFNYGASSRIKLAKDGFYERVHTVLMNDEIEESKTNLRNQIRLLKRRINQQ